MGRWASTIVIAGENFSGCRGEIQNGAEFLSPYKGSVEIAASGRPNTQHVNTNYKGLSFGIVMISVELIKFNAMKTAITAAQVAGNTFAVNLVDELYSINVNAVVDYNKQWVTHGQPSNGWIPNVTLWFISDSVIS